MFEYKFVEIPISSDKKIIAELNKHGKKGWEVIDISHITNLDEGGKGYERYFMKRQVRQKEKEKNL